MRSMKPTRSRSLRSGVHQPENVVEDVVATVLGQKLECLRIAHRSLLRFDQERSTDDDENSAGGVAGLGIQGCDLVLDLREREVLMSSISRRHSDSLACIDIRTTSFCTMLAAPDKGAASKVNIESGP